MCESHALSATGALFVESFQVFLNLEAKIGQPIGEQFMESPCSKRTAHEP
jgi:hypothetical protein